MSTIYTNFFTGALDADPGVSGTTLSGTQFASLDVVAAPNTMWLVLDPEGLFGAPEIVKITAHTASATTCTVTRAQQGTTARAHDIGTVVQVALTKTDLDELPFRKMTTRGDLVYASAANTASRLAVGTSGQALVSDGTDPTWGQVGAAGLAAAVAGAGLAGGNGTALSVNVDGSTLEIPVDTLQVKDGGITAAKLAAAVAGAGLTGGAGTALAVNADGSTLEVATDTLQIKAGGVGATQLAAAVAGSGLAGGAGSALSVNVDGTSIEIATDTLQVKDAGITAAKLAAAVAGSGLTGGAGTALAVNVDGSTLEVATDTVQVKDGGITNAKLATSSGEIGAAWPSYSPTTTATVTNPTLGSGGATTGKRKYVGKDVHFKFQMAFGTSGTAAGSGTYLISLPTAAAADEVGYPIGVVTLNNSGTEYTYFLYVNDVNHVRMVAGDGTVVTHAAPFAWGASDFARGHGTYEAA